MSESELRQAILTRLNGIENIGVVYDYERWAVTYAGILDLYRVKINGQSVIRGFTITCEGFDQNRLTFGMGGKGQIQRVYHYKVRGYYGLNDADATEKAAIALFIQVVENLEDHLRLVDASQHTTPPSLLFQPRLFGDILCHYAEISFDINQVHQIV